MNTTLNDAVTTYVDAVRDALSDLPADEVAEIVEDITEHLDQVAAEIGGDVSRADLEARPGRQRTTPRNSARQPDSHHPHLRPGSAACRIGAVRCDSS